MEDIKKLVFEVLERGYLMSLGTVDENGPWVSDVIFVYEWNIYPHTKQAQDVGVAENAKLNSAKPISPHDSLGTHVCNSACYGVGVYWISENFTRHSKAILKNPKVAATITVSNNQGEDNVGLQIEGTAEKIKGDILELAKQHRRKRKKPEPEKEGEILDEGESWYRLKPIKIELIYEPLFGFDKKVLEL